jgi:hypothetical protein
MMRGSLRALFGFLVVFGAAGGMDNATDAQLGTLCVIAAAGLLAMASGVRAMRTV